MAIAVTTMHGATVQFTLIALVLTIETVRTDMVTVLIERDARYRGEVHKVTTRDGFILSLHRVVRRDSLVNTTYPPVVLWHGLINSAADWLVLGPGKSFPFVLADRGHDVWLANSRGNVYSRSHKRLVNTSAAFWDFSFHEMGTLDAPAVVDYVLRMHRGRHRRIHLVGHSQGVSLSFVLLSMLPQYNERVARVYGLSPVAFLDHLVLTMLPSYKTILDTLTINFNRNNLFEINSLPRISDGLCNTTVARKDVCKLLLRIVPGLSKYEMKKGVEAQVLAGIPAGAAIKQFIHYGQMAYSHRFEPYDYAPNRMRNVQKYGRDTPAPYNLSKIVTPYALYYASEDLILFPIDAEKLLGKLPCVTKVRRLDGWNHVDFLYNEVALGMYDEIANDMESTLKNVRISCRAF